MTTSVVWDFGEETFEMRGNVGKLHSKQSRAAVRRLFVDEETVVPAKHQAHVPVTTTFTSLTGSGIWVVKAKVINRDTVVASSLHDESSVKTVVRIVNLSDKPRKFHRGELVTESEMVELCENTEEIASPGTPDNPIVTDLSDPLNESDIPFDFSLKRHQQELFEIKTTESDLGHLDSMLENMGPTLTSQQRIEASEFLKKYGDVFSKSDYDLSRTGLVKHIIDTGENRPFKQQLRRHPMAHLPVIDQHVSDMLEREIIELSSSPWASNVVLVRKADNSLRFCVDYRHPNALTVKDSYPLPTIDTCFDALG